MGIIKDALASKAMTDEVPLGKYQKPRYRGQGLGGTTRGRAKLAQPSPRYARPDPGRAG